MRSAERHHGARRAAVLTVLLAAGPLAGCATTQQEAARLQLNSARIRASEVAVVVHKAGPAVVAGAVAMITGTAGSAVLVVVRNRTRSPIGDLPISVGILAAGGARAYLNATAGLPYFDTHLPGVPARGSLRWVFTTARRLPARARPFALIGPAQAPGASYPQTLPAISARIRSSSARDNISTLSLVVHNLSGVPQYQLPVYAFVRRGSRYLAAGGALIAHLTSDASTKLQLRLLGDDFGASVQVETPPSIFQ